MAGKIYKDIRAWERDHNRMIDDTFNEAVTASIGGMAGDIPVETGRLARSKEIAVNGVPSDDGLPTVTASDQVGVTWGAHYAAAVHFGSANRKGAHWLDKAAADWPEQVAAAAAKAKAKIGE